MSNASEGDRGKGEEKDVHGAGMVAFSLSRLRSNAYFLYSWIDWKNYSKLFVLIETLFNYFFQDFWERLLCIGNAAK
jgi:hypothetical protein